MPKPKHVVQLSDEQRDRLRKFTRSGKAPAREIAHARILLKADEGHKDAVIAEALEISPPTISRVRKRFALEGLDAALKHRTPSATKPRKLDGRLEAHLIALACSEPPEERARWTLRLLADRLVELGHVSGVSPETVRATLKKTSFHLT